MGHHLGWNGSRWLRAKGRIAGYTELTNRPGQSRRRCAPGAPDRLAPVRSATSPVARRRSLRDAENFDEEVSLLNLPPSHHSITSSASARSLAGISNLRVLAVWTLMVSSNLVARSIGRSAGFAPLRMRPA